MSIRCNYRVATILLCSNYPYFVYLLLKHCLLVILLSHQCYFHKVIQTMYTPVLLFFRAHESSQSELSSWLHPKSFVTRPIRICRYCIWYWDLSIVPTKKQTESWLKTIWIIKVRGEVASFHFLDLILMHGENPRWSVMLIQRLPSDKIKQIYPQTLLKNVICTLVLWPSFWLHIIPELSHIFYDNDEL